MLATPRREAFGNVAHRLLPTAQQSALRGEGKPLFHRTAFAMNLLDWPFPQDADRGLSPAVFDWRDPQHPFHVYHMELCLEEAVQAAAEEEVPVGAVIVHPQRGLIAAAHNQRERLQDPTAHAEMIALTQAAQALRSWRLEQCILYVTLEPCAMCAGAAVNARLALIVYGAEDPKAGACRSLYQIPSDPRLPHRLPVVGGVLAERCAALLSDFFRQRRRWGRK